jgi:Predicted metal-dependent hydrolases related to alanyl-tRNA synthetase HxxxH domain
MVDRPVKIGQTVECALDWARRFDHMQQHSGEHILSGILCGSYHCDNVGFHMVSRSRTVTQLSAEVLSSPTVAKSTVMQNGVPISSSRR